jgi:hypothetical protein
MALLLMNVGYVNDEPHDNILFFHFNNKIKRSWIQENSY